MSKDQETPPFNDFAPSIYYVADMIGISSDFLDGSMSSETDLAGSPFSEGDASIEITKLDIDESQGEEAIRKQIQTHMAEAKAQLADGTDSEILIEGSALDLDDGDDGVIILDMFAKASEEDLQNMSDETLALQMYFRPKDESIKAAKKQLKSDPTNIEAQLCLIGWEEQEAKQMEALEDLLEKQEDLLEFSDEFFETDKGRSYLRLKTQLAERYLIGNFTEDGMELIQEVYKEDKRNDFDAGFVIAVELGKQGKWPSLVKFWEEYDAQVNIVTSILRAISYFNMYGNKVKSKQALQAAVSLDSTPFDIISGAVSMEEMDDSAYGGADALFATQMMYDLMSKNEKLMRWVVTNVMRQ